MPLIMPNTVFVVVLTLSLSLNEHKWPGCIQMETVADEKTSKTIILGSLGSGLRVSLICEDQLFLSIENRVRSGSY